MHALGVREQIVGQALPSLDGDGMTALSAMDIGLTEDNGWHCHRNAGFMLWFKGHLADDGLSRLVATLGARGALDMDAAAQILADLEGHWALAAVGPSWALAAVDRVRSIPLIWAPLNGAVMVDQDGGRLARRLGLQPIQVDADAALAIALSGFTIGNDTLYRQVRQIGPGEFVLVEQSGAGNHGRYHQWTPWLAEPVAPEDIAAPLKSLHERLISALVDSARGRQILVPLSAGLDSRFIASGLREAGYENVVCFAYGTPGNREAAVSRRIAERLGYPWHFVPFSSTAMQATFAGEDHARFRAGADSLTGVHFPQDYLALKHLLDDGLADTKSIVVNGQSGDFITGNHIPAVLATPHHNRSPAARRKAIIEALLAKHFKQWEFLRTPVNVARLSKRLGQEIDIIGLPAGAGNDYGIYEYCEFRDRQAKYVVGGQRAYEHFGLDWRLPLWDQDYLDFWASAPLAAKARQSLYRNVLREQNWGRVWGDDMPVNPTRIRPLWLWPIRLGLKALHAPMGRARWHAFERRYLAYWMSPTCPYGGHSWTEIARDNRGHWSGISWHIADYLAGRGVDIDNLPG